MEDQISMSNDFSAVPAEKWVAESIEFFLKDRKPIIREFYFINNISHEIMSTYIDRVAAGVKANIDTIDSEGLVALISADKNGAWIKLRIRDKNDPQIKKVLR
jgi:hypothetical protein